MSIRTTLPIYGESDHDLKPGMYLALFHGRDNPEQVMEGWGFNGPVIGPLESVHTTYASTIHLAFVEHEDWRRYFPTENVVSSMTNGPAARIRGLAGLTEEEIGPFDSRIGGWPLLNDSAERQRLLDAGLITSFEFKTDGELEINKDGLIEYDGKFYGDWTVYVVGHVLPTAAQIAAGLTDRPDLVDRFRALEGDLVRLAGEALS